MDEHTLSDFATDLSLELRSLDLIKENKYCLIYLAGTKSGSCIIKKYKAGDPSLVSVEAQALRFYHSLARNDPTLMDSGEPLLREDKRLLRIGFIEGEPFSDVLYKARRDETLRKRSVRLMGVLGRLVGAMYEKTQRPHEETSPFIFEYFEYCSKRLESIPFFGSLLFKGLSSDSKELADSFRRGKVIPSFVHGDFVFKNIHIKEDRLGLIDFANANTRSHPLNDIYNLRFALANMLLPKSFKEELLDGFFAGLNLPAFSEAAEKFYYEYHRRRWLMLKLISRNPWDVAQGLRGLVTFAARFSREVIGR